MGNFDFLRETLPGVFPDSARAESYLTSDPRAACIYSRRAAELLVNHLYDVLALREPYRDDFAAKANDPVFKARVGSGIQAKLNLIRLNGNDAVHKPKPVPPGTALATLRELFHVMIWAAFRHSPNPGAVPTGRQFDPQLAARSAPLTRERVQQLAAKFTAQDEAHARELAERDEARAQLEAELSELRAQIAAAQAVNTQTDDHDYNEAETRDLFIDRLLNEAGWPLADARDREYEVDGMPNAQSKGYVDYVLWGADGLPLAVVEAKRTTKSPAIGQKQAELYADALERRFGRRPVIFYTNGYEHWLWDDAAGYPPREVQGFLTRDELELAIQRRSTRRRLATEPVNTDVAGRAYQQRAIKAVGEAFDGKERRALLAMATGSGKTRTVIALIEQLMKAGWVKRALFLADRTALVTQAANAFKAHLPQSSPVNLVTERKGDGRVYLSTYPTMLNLLGEVDDGGRRFGPGFFDLIVVDEAHRSVYAKYKAIFDHFDALLVGLTATPKDEVAHNTYQLVHLEDGVPTDAYSLDEAVADGYLVPPRAVSVGTQFLRQGIRYDDLSDDEKDQWDALEWGDDGPPAEVGSEEINRFLFNEDTVDKVLATLMTDGYTVAGGDRLGKTIVFAKNQQHAEFIQRRFDLGWPEHAGRFARVITHSVPYAQQLIDDFSVPDKPPHIAISVDMLDTGIDVPEVLNLVFFKMVRSKSKFWQMIGRGTRLRPDLFGPGRDKTDFLVFDFCGNLEFFSQDLPGSEGSVQKSLTQRIFEGRLAMVQALDTAGGERELRASTAGWLREVVDGMTLDNVLVRPHRRAVERFSQADAWESLTADGAALALTLSGLPSQVTDDDEAAKRFDLLILRRQLAQLEGDAVAAERVREAVQEIASGLLGKLTIPAVKERAELLEEVAGDDWWVDVTLPMLELVRVRVRSLVRFADKATRATVYTDFEDTLGEAVEITLPGVTPGTDVERFRAKARGYLRMHEDALALQRLRRNKQLTSQDLSELEGMLHDAGAGPADLVWAAHQPGGLGLFIRSLVGLERAAAEEAFTDFLGDGAGYTVSQVRFVDLIVKELTTQGAMEPARLFESPYTDVAATGPDGLFAEGDVGKIVDILGAVRSTAVVAATG